VKLCVYCGEALIDLTRDSASTRTLEDTDFEENIPKWGSARFTSRIHLIINYDGEDHYLTIETADMNQLPIGRVDPHTGRRPPIDLTDYGALDKGVSRHHAALLRKDGSLHIVDKGSPNGTFLNGQRLVTDQPRVLRDGDDIRLAHLVMRVQFERS
jgi:pSer/pThr/pTyr-binding forkhead associated (FHA) protein